MSGQRLERCGTRAWQRCPTHSLAQLLTNPWAICPVSLCTQVLYLQNNNVTLHVSATPRGVHRDGARGTPVIFAYNIGGSIAEDLPLAALVTWRHYPWLARPCRSPAICPHDYAVLIRFAWLPAVGGLESRISAPRCSAHCALLCIATWLLDWCGCGGSTSSSRWRSTSMPSRACQLRPREILDLWDDLLDDLASNIAQG